MSRLRDALLRVAEDLGERRWALVGGLAVSARTEPRFTRDVDIAVSVANDADAERLVHSLLAKRYRVLAAVEQEEAKRLATIRLIPPGEEAGGVIVDLLFASSGIEPEIVASAEPLEVMEGCSAPVASAAHLLALKILARDDRRRPQDRGDITALFAGADEAMLSDLRGALNLIVERGFARGKDLHAELRRAMAES